MIESDGAEPKKVTFIETGSTSISHVWEDQRAAMGGDLWKFAIRANEMVLNTIVRYAEGCWQNR